MILNEELILQGKLPAAKERCKRFGIGFEKLDRDAFDPEGKYEKLSELGGKWVRLLSGWEKTEQKEGVYDFAWLDKIVNNIIEHGMTPWICLSYGNPLYSQKAKEVFGSVGCPPIFSEREKEAWVAYCKAVVKHYAGRVNAYEIWNEPDGRQCWKHGSNGKEYGEFCVMTARAIRAVNPSAFIIGGALGVTKNVVEFLSLALQTGMGKEIDALSYHRYTIKPEDNIKFCKEIRKLLLGFGVDIPLIHGEIGCPSSNKGNGSLHANLWTERKQAKLLLRTFVADLCAGVQFTSWFSLVDMAEALFGTRGDTSSYQDYGYFGLLSAQFNEKGVAVGSFERKQSYYAYRNLASFLGGEWKEISMRYDSPMRNDWTLEWSFDYGEIVEDGEDFISFGIEKKGVKAMLYYKPANVLTTEYEHVTTLRFYNVNEKAHIIDFMTGEVFEVPEGKILREGGYVTVKQFPVKDYPLAIVFGKIGK